MAFHPTKMPSTESEEKRILQTNVSCGVYMLFFYFLLETALFARHVKSKKMWFSVVSRTHQQVFCCTGYMVLVYNDIGITKQDASVLIQEVFRCLKFSLDYTWEHVHNEYVLQAFMPCKDMYYLICITGY
ncbi:hypothetical protein PS15p_212233 [Mucor circinelloides]